MKKGYSKKPRSLSAPTDSINFVKKRHITLDDELDHEFAYAVMRNSLRCSSITDFVNSNNESIKQNRSNYKKNISNSLLLLMKEFYSKKSTSNKMKISQLVLNFDSDSSSFDLMKSTIEKQAICLKSFDLEKNIILLTVMVKNINFEKNIKIIFTIDDWKTQNEYKLDYIYTQSDHCDVFGCKIDLYTLLKYINEKEKLEESSEIFEKSRFFEDLSFKKFLDDYNDPSKQIVQCHSELFTSEKSISQLTPLAKHFEENLLINSLRTQIKIESNRNDEKKLFIKPSTIQIPKLPNIEHQLSNTTRSVDEWDILSLNHSLTIPKCFIGDILDPKLDFSDLNDKEMSNNSGIRRNAILSNNSNRNLYDINSNYRILSPISRISKVNKDEFESKKNIEANVPENHQKYPQSPVPNIKPVESYICENNLSYLTDDCDKKYSTTASEQLVMYTSKINSNSVIGCDSKNNTFIRQNIRDRSKSHYKINLEFAFSYNVCDREYWDNNQGKNYRIENISVKPNRMNSR